MRRRLTLSFLVLALAAGIVSGTPLHAPNDKMMPCCDKAKNGGESTEASMARLCCGMNCSESSPIPSGATFNFAPSSTTISRSIAEQIAALFPVGQAPKAASQKYSRKTFSRILQPKYLQYNSLLI